MVLIEPVYRCGDTEGDVIIFPNGYSFSIRFGVDDYFDGTRFDSECRHCVLKDPEGNIISEITEKNPHEIPEDIRKSFFGW